MKIMKMRYGTNSLLDNLDNYHNQAVKNGNNNNSQI